MYNLPKTEKTFTILELNNAVRQLIKTEFPEYLWVCGEIKDLRASRDKKHIYFDLVQKHPDADEIVARVSAALFAGRKPRIFKRINDTNGAFELKNDIEVKFLCEVDLYPKSGQFSVIIVDIDPVYTLGKFAQNRQRIIEELQRKGALDKNKQLSLPLLPLTIGLITSFGSAAYHDFINELTQSAYGFKVRVYDAHMQGKNVEADVVAGINYFNKRDVDVIVISRGGGSTADLSWFDNQAIAETIAKSQVAVITGLGHEINISITDLAAHTSLKTPTKVAQFLTQTIGDFSEQVEYYQDQIVAGAQACIEREMKSLRTLALEFESSVLQYFRDHRELLTRYNQDCLHLSRNFVVYKRREISERVRFLKMYASNLLTKCNDHLLHTKEKVDLLNPRKVLKRGYTITYRGAKTVKDSSRLNKGDVLNTVFFKGYAESYVEKVGEKDEEKQ
jgi:exodeoxyribonuclease VII large subunit